jgi:hypothetical protein
MPIFQLLLIYRISSDMMLLVFCELEKDSLGSLGLEWYVSLRAEDLRISGDVQSMYRAGLGSVRDSGNLMCKQQWSPATSGLG